MSNPDWSLKVRIKEIDKLKRIENMIRTSDNFNLFVTSEYKPKGKIHRATYKQFVKGRVKGRLH